MMDVALTVMNVVGNVLLGGAALVMLIDLVLSICCEELSEEQAAAERRDELVVEYALAWRSAEEPPATAEVELMRPVVPVAPAPVVAQLGYFLYLAEGRSASEKLVCAICLEVFEHGAVCSEVPACQHLFHKDCIDVWMETKTTCPLCRRHIVAGSERLSAADDMV